MNHMRPIITIDEPPDWPQPPIEIYATEAIEPEPEPEKPGPVDPIQSLRAKLFDAGFKPIPLYSWNHPGTSPGKRPLGSGWQIEARQPTPFCVTHNAVPHALNTGILCDGLRGLDIDVDDAEIAGRVKALAIETFGDAPLRYRANSPRVTLVYRAAAGEPEKKSITGSFGKVEILGKGQQFAAFGRHHTGAELQWQRSLTEWPRDTLPAITETAVAAFLSAAATIIGADAPKATPDHQTEHAPSQFGPSADPLDIAAALAAIPNLTRDWDHWCRVGLATFAASGGSPEGFAAWAAWSSRCEAHDIAACRAAWAGYEKNPPDDIGVGTLIFLAKEARPGWTKPTEAAPSAGAALPDLVDHPGDLPATERAAMRRIEAVAVDLRLFDRGGDLIRLVAPPDKPIRFHPVTHHTITGLVHSVCRPVRLKENPKTKEIDVIPVTFPRRGAESMAESSEWKLPILDGVACAPLLHETGSIRTTNGYDPATRLWCENMPDVAVSPRPSRQDAATALRVIRTAFATFPFKDSARVTAFDADLVDLDQPPGNAESAFLHGLMTAICKPSLWLTPGLIVNAPQQSGAGSGKGLLISAICQIAYGAPPVSITAGHSADELEKRIVTSLMTASNAIFLDNANGLALTSSTLENVITERPAAARVFNTTGMKTLNSTAFVALTGNGLTVSEDMARRILICEIDAKMEDPESREFPDGRDGFLNGIRDRRGELLAAVLTVWRWGRQNEASLTRGKPFGSFETWAKWIRDPLLTLGCPDPVLAIAAAKARDPKRRQTAELFEAWWAAHDRLPMMAKDLCDEVKAILDPHNRGRQTIIAALTAKVDTRAAGYVLTKQDAPGAWGKATYRLEKTTVQS